MGRSPGSPGVGLPVLSIACAHLRHTRLVYGNIINMRRQLLVYATIRVANIHYLHARGTVRKPGCKRTRGSILSGGEKPYAIPPPPNEPQTAPKVP